MVESLSKRGWKLRIQALRMKAMAGDVSAATEVGLTLLEGIRGRDGQSIVRRDSRAAVVFLRKAAIAGDDTAASSLGYAYDIGLGT